MIDIEVVDAQLDYNVLLVCNYMYAMKVVASKYSPSWCFPTKERL